MKRVWIELRPFLAPLAILAVCGIARLVFFTVLGDRGVLDHTEIDGTHAVLAFVTFALRLLALVVVPMTIVYRLAMRLARRWL
jgi:hypothetical protein